MREVLFADLVGAERAARHGGTRAGRDAAKVLARQHALGERRERYAANALLAEHVEQATLEEDKPARYTGLNLQLTCQHATRGHLRQRAIPFPAFSSDRDDRRRNWRILDLADAGPHPDRAHAAWGGGPTGWSPTPRQRRRWRGCSRSGWPGTAWPGSPAPSTTPRSRARPPPTPDEPAPQRQRVDAAHRPRDPAQPPLHRPSGVEPPANRQRPGRPGEHRAGSPARAAVEPARGVGHLRPPGPPLRSLAKLTSSASRTWRPAAARAARRAAATCWWGCCAAGSASGTWNPAGPTASPPTGAATATPAPPGLTPPGPGTPTSAR